MIEQDGQYYRFQCPHCHIDIEVHQKEINCKIFRCGIFKRNGQPIGPHTKKEECEKLVSQNVIFGCGKPFKFNGTKVEICDYI